MTETDEPRSPARGRATPPNRDCPAMIAAHLWNRRLFIAKVLGIAIVLYAIVLLLIPNRFRAEATVIILPPRFTSEVRTEPLSVSTAKSLLESGEIIQQIIVTVRDARSALAKYVLDHAGDRQVLGQLSGMPQEQVERALSLKDPTLAAYLGRLSAGELSALAGLDSSEVEDWTVEELEQSLESEDIVEKKTASDIKLSPLLKLYAVADSAPESQLLANTWAWLFEKKYDELTSQKTRGQYESIEKQQRESQTELARVQSLIVDFKAQNNMELYQKQIDEYSEDFREFTNQLVIKGNALQSERKKLTMLYAVVKSVETSGGRWLGRVDTGDIADFVASGTPESGPEQALQTSSLADEVLTSSLAAAGLAEEGVPGQPEAIASETAGSAELLANLRTKVEQSRERILTGLSDLRSFYQKYPVKLMESQRDQLQKDYVESLGKYRMGQVRLQVLQKSLASLDGQLSRTKQAIQFNTGVPDISIAQAIMSGQKQEMEKLSRLRFEREEINPVWNGLQAERTKMGQELEMTRNEVNELEAVLQDRERQVQDLQDRIYQAQASEALVRDNLTRWQHANTDLFQNYVETNNTIYNTSRDVTLLAQEVQQLEQATSRTKQLVEHYQQLYNGAAAELQRLESRMRAIQRNADLLLQKFQEAQIAIREEVSDVSIAAAAVTPQKHFYPKRSLSLAVLTLLTAAALLGMLARSKYLELQSDSV